MNWNLILNKYPRSILDNEKALLILAVLERNGLATEDELKNSTNFEQFLLKEVLIDLQLNRFIQYGSNYVRLTEKGKNIIDRFGLLEPVISDFLDGLGYKGKEKKDYEYVLFQYRNSSFEFYQNSLCTVRTWKFLAEEIPSRITSPNFFDQLIGGMRSLLLRDLRNWWAHSYQPSSIFRDVNKDIELLICSTKLEEVDSLFVTDIARGYSLEFLNELEKQNLNLDSSCPYNIKAEIEPLISAFHVFQYNSSPFEWFEDFCTLLPDITIRKKDENKEILLKVLNTLLDRSKGKHRLQKTNEKISINIYHNWIPTRQDFLLNSDILEMLMMVSDITELSKRTGIQEEPLKEMLIDIRNRCDTILSAKHDKVGTKKKKEEIIREK